MPALHEFILAKNYSFCHLAFLFLIFLKVFYSTRIRETNPNRSGGAKCRPPTRRSKIGKFNSGAGERSRTAVICLPARRRPERDTRVELASSPWKGDIITVIRIPLWQAGKAEALTAVLHPQNKRKNNKNLLYLKMLCYGGGRKLRYYHYTIPACVPLCGTTAGKPANCEWLALRSLGEVGSGRGDSPRTRINSVRGKNSD